MSRDTLSDLLRTVRLRGALFFHLEGAETWVAETPRAVEIIPGVMPGVDHLIPFHGVARGSCWAGIVDETPIPLAEGDLVLFTQGDPHVISSAPGMRVERTDLDIYFAPKPNQLPFSLSLHEEGASAVRLFRDEQVRARIVCGYLGFDAKPFNPLIDSLPRVLRIPGLAADGTSWIGNILASVVEESNRKRPGGEAVLERMSEMLFVEVLRRYADTLPEEQTGWLAGMRDPVVGRALTLIHERPAEAWTIERLGEEAAVSRSTMHERFVHFLGQPPIQYLTQWRMQVASAWLRDSDAKVIEIAFEVGYESEASFVRAFKRAVGESPGAWRQARRLRARA